MPKGPSSKDQSVTHILKPSGINSELSNSVKAISGKLVEQNNYLTVEMCPNG